MSAAAKYVFLKMNGQPCATAAEADIVAEYVDFGAEAPVLPLYRVRDKHGVWREFASNDLIEIKRQVRADKENFNFSE